jgi:WD40 repeat protein
VETRTRRAVPRSVDSRVGGLAGNPYVGPTPYSENDDHVFEGRELDAASLLALAIAERVVVFHSESGAGKTSLINMRLIPQLRREAFQVFYIPHLGRPLPRGIDQNSVKNIFSFNAVAHLASLPVVCPQPSREGKRGIGERAGNIKSAPELMPERRQVSSTAVTAPPSYVSKPRKKSKSGTGPLLTSSMNEFLPAFIDQHTVAGAGPLSFRGSVLVFDQFEELLTEHPDRWADREAFFEDVELALEKLPFLSFVFVVRQDSLATLDRYAHFIPGRFGARFRMELFTAQQAIPAIRIPAELAGRPFERDVAEQLANNLASRQMIQREETYIGEFIEPVYLQVVCYGLWKRLASRPGISISMNDLKAYGNIDEALEQFYENGVREVSQLTGVLETRIRRWFDLLITKSGRRAQVSHEYRESGGLSNEVIGLLEDRHLVRSESVAGTKVYLLTHDRLVASVISVNARLRSGSSNPLSVPTKKWEQDGLNPRHLLRGKDLRIARLWSEANPELLSRSEGDFLKASLSAEAEEAVKFRRYFLMAVCAIVLAIAATITALVSLRGTKNQEEATQAQERQSESKSLALQSLETLPNDAEKSLLLALHAVSKTYHEERPTPPLLRVLETLPIEPVKSLLPLLHVWRTYPKDQESTPEALNALAEAVHATSRLQLSMQMQAPVKKISFSPGGHWLATLDDTGHFAIWNAVSGEELLSLHEATYTDMALARSDSDLTEIGVEQIVFAVGDNKGEVEVAYTDSRKLPRKFSEACPISSTSFTGDGSKLVIGCIDGTIIEENLQNQQSRRFNVPNSSSPIMATRYLPDGNHLLVLTSDTVALVPSVEGPIDSFRIPFSALSFAISEDSKRVLLAAGNQRIIQIEINPTITERETLRVRDAVSSLQFGPGESMVVGATGGYAMVLDSSDNELLHVKGHLGKVTSTSYSPNGQRLATAGQDGKVMIWNALYSHATPLTSIAFSPTGSRLAAISLDGDISIWDVESQEEINRFSLNQDSIKSQIAKHSTDPRFGVAQPMQIAYWGDATRIFVADGTSLVVVNAESPNVSPRAFAINAASVAFSPDGSRVAIGTLDGKLLMWNPGLMRLESNKSKILVSKAAVTAVAFTPDDRGIITATRAGEVDLWNSSTMEKVAHLLSVKNGVSGISVHPLGDLLAAAGGDARIHLVDLNLRVEKSSNETGPGYGSPLLGVAFSNDGERLASVAGDGEVRVWDFSKHRIVYSYRGTAAGLYPIAFSPVKPLLAGIGGDRDVLFRPIEVKDALANARLRLTRPWTDQECRDYLDENHEKSCPAELQGLQFFVKAIDFAKRGMTEQDENKAKQDFSSAVEQFRNASNMYPVLSIDNPIDVAKEVSSATEIREIRNARILNQWPDVLQIIRLASARAQYMSEDKSHEFANQLLVASLQLARLGDTDRAVEAMALAGRRIGNSASIQPVYLNNLCWFGTLWGRAKDVVQYCRIAREFSSDDVNFGDSLGLAMSETDNSHAPEAIGLFESFVASPESNSEERTQRATWIKRIQSGKRPLTHGVRIQLITQGLSEVELACSAGIQSSCVAYEDAMRKASQLK